MRIILLMNLIGVNTGVPNKVYAYANTLKNLGHTVYVIPLYGYLGLEDKFSEFKIFGTDKYIRLIKEKKFNILRRIIYLSKLLKSVKADIILFRYTPRPDILVAILLSRVPFIVEHNTMEFKEFMNARQWRSAIADKCFGWILRSLSSGIVGVTSEILNYQLRKSIFLKQGIVISNSIDLSAYSNFKKAILGQKRFVFVGNIDYWQGVDRAVSLMAKLPDFQLFVIGSGRETQSLHNLTHMLGVSDRIHFLGRMEGKQLEEFLLTCDIAISSLAVYRKGLKQACPLKTRYYLALGLPVIIGYDDVDLTEDMPFVLRVSGDGNPISEIAVKVFYEQMVSEPFICTQIRLFAENNLSTKIKMQKLLGFIENAVLESPKHA